MAICTSGRMPYHALLVGSISKPWPLQARVKALSEIVEQLVTSVSQNKDVDLNLIKKTASHPVPFDRPPLRLTSQKEDTPASASIGLHVSLSSWHLSHQLG